MEGEKGTGRAVADVQQGEQSLSPPYISYLSFKNFLQWLDDEGVPLRFDRSSWDKKYSGSTGPQLMNGLRFLGLLKSEKPEPDLERLVEAKGEDRKAVLREIFRQRYIAINFDELPRATTGMLRDWFNYYGIEGDTVRKAESFFINAAKDSDVPMSNALRKMARNRSAKSSKGIKKQNNMGAGRGNRDEDPGHPSDPPPSDHGERNQSNVAKVTLDSGGEVSLILSVDLFALTQRDREFVMGLVDKVRGYRDELPEKNIASSDTPVTEVPEQDN